MNKNEFLSIRNGWLSEAAKDLRNRVTDFMRKNGVREAQLADILGLGTNSVRKMLNGRANELTLEEFASVLIASGHMLQIVPVGATPFAKGGHRAPMPHPTAQPTRDARGRFARREEVPQPQFGGQPMGGGMFPTPEEVRGMVAEAEQQPEEMPTFDAMSRAELVNFVRENGWENEIDLVLADREQIIAFLESKTQPAEEEVNNDVTAAPSNEDAAFAESLMRELQNNPQLLNALRASLGR